MAPLVIHFNSVSVVYKMDVLSFSCLETSPAIKYLLFKNQKCHKNDIFVDREKYEEFHPSFHQLLEQDDNFFGCTRTTKPTLYYILENIKDKIQKRYPCLWHSAFPWSRKLLLSSTKRNKNRSHTMNISFRIENLKRTENVRGRNVMRFAANAEIFIITIRALDF